MNEGNELLITSPFQLKELTETSLLGIHKVKIYFDLWCKLDLGKLRLILQSSCVRELILLHFNRLLVNVHELTQGFFEARYLEKLSLCTVDYTRLKLPKILMGNLCLTLRELRLSRFYCNERSIVLFIRALRNNDTLCLLEIGNVFKYCRKFAPSKPIFDLVESKRTQILGESSSV